MNTNNTNNTNNANNADDTNNSNYTNDAEVLKVLYFYGKYYCLMPFSQGQKTFALIFIISFAIMLFFAYRSDLKMIRIYYKNVWVVLLGIAVVLTLLVFLIRLTH